MQDYVLHIICQWEMPILGCRQVALTYTMNVIACVCANVNILFFFGCYNSKPAFDYKMTMLFVLV